MKVLPIPVLLLALITLSLPACNKLEEQVHGEQQQAGEQSAEGSHAGEEHASSEEHEGEGEGHESEHMILVTSPIRRDVVSTQRYVCQIHSRRHIEVCALEGGYLEEIQVKEGQAVKQGDLLFRILPVLYQAKLDSEIAEAQLRQIEFSNTQKLYEQKIVSKQEVALVKAKLAKAQAMVKLTQAELNFAYIKAPFDGIIGQQLHQQGSLIAEGDVLTTMSDNDVMWVYFNVPEARYLEYKAAMEKGEDQGLTIELMLADHTIFPHPGKISAIEADFNNTTGNIAFRADFSNPNGLLRHGQTGTIMIHRVLKDVLVIPQRATYEILAKRYAFVVDKEGVVHQRDITIQTELDDIFVLKSGLKEGDKIILEGIRQVRAGDKVKYEFRDPHKVLENLKYKAE